MIGRSVFLFPISSESVRVTLIRVEKLLNRKIVFENDSQCHISGSTLGSNRGLLGAV